MALHCPATLLVARPGEAAYADPGVQSEAGGSLTGVGRAQVRALAGSLGTRRVAAVYSSELSRAVESAALAAGLLGVGSYTVPGLQELAAGTVAGRIADDPALSAVLADWVAGDLDARTPGAESGGEVLQRYGWALATIADQYRGETVLVFSHAAVMSFCLPRLGSDVRAVRTAPGPVASCAVVELAVDDHVEIVGWAEPLG